MHLLVCRVHTTGKVSSSIKKKGTHNKNKSGELEWSGNCGSPPTSVHFHGNPEFYLHGGGEVSSYFLKRKQGGKQYYILLYYISILYYYIIFQYFVNQKSHWFHKVKS